MAWTDERRAKQRAMVLTRRPWEKSTGPKTPKGKARASKNSRKHGLRSAPARDIAKQRTAAKREEWAVFSAKVREELRKR